MQSGALVYLSSLVLLFIHCPLAGRAEHGGRLSASDITPRGRVSAASIAVLPALQYLNSYKLGGGWPAPVGIR